MSGEAVFEGDKTSIKLIEQQTIGQLLDATCRNQGVREALVFSNEQLQLTFTQIVAQVNKIAAGFLSIGLKSGDVVVLWGANHSNNVLSVLACARLGLVFSNLAHTSTAVGLQQHLNAVGAKALICFPTVKPGHCYELLSGIDSGLTSGQKGNLNSKAFAALKYLILDEDDAKQSGIFTLSEIIALGAKDKTASDKMLNEASASITADSVATIQATSGSVSGDPKFVSLTHFQVINSCLTAATRLNLQNATEILCCPLPIFRGPVLCLAVMSVAVVGAKVVYPSALPMPPAIFESIQNQKCTCLLTNPIALHLMLRMPVAKKFSIDSLKTLCLGADHTTAEQVLTFQEKIPKLEDIASAVFLTEAGVMPVVYPPKSKFEDIGKWDGKVADHYAAKILDFDGKPAKFDTPGQLCLKLVGGSKFLGYLNQSKDGPNEWFSTDDVATLSQNGYVTLLGRLSEVIFCNKVPIIPLYIEKVLSLHAAVAGCQVVGISDPKVGEKVCACLIKKDNVSLSDDELKAEMLELCRKEKVRVPDSILFLEEFPRNQAKKVQKSKLKLIAADILKR